jgi:transposase
VQSTSSVSRGSKKKGTQAIGVSRGGLNTKIHAVCDALGNPLRFKLTPGNASDTPELIGLIEGLPGQELLADKAYDSDAIVQGATDKGMEIVIAPKANRKEKRVFDKLKYRARHLIENLFQRMKIYRRVATRYEKLDTRYLSVIHLIGAMKWLQ